MSEQWCPVAGYEGFYSVSSMGRIRSEARVVLYRTGKRQSVRERIMSPASKVLGHRSVMFYPQRKRLHVHRLVALAFIGPPPTALHEVAHRDGDPSNNVVTNLRWSTRSDNHADKVAHGTHNRGERHPLSKLSDVEARAIRTSPRSSKQLATDYGISAGHAWAVKTGRARSFA